jgi:O-antigen ligase
MSVATSRISSQFKTITLNNMFRDTLLAFWRSCQLNWLTLGFVALAVGLGAGLALLVTKTANPMVIVFVVAGVLAACAAVVWIEWGLLTLIFMTYVNLSDVLIKHYGAPSTARLYIALLLAAILIRWLLARERPTGWLRPAVLLGLVGLVRTASLFYAADPARTWAGLDDYFKDAMVALIVFTLLQRATTLRRVIWTLLAAGIFMGTITVYQQLTGTFDNPYWGFGTTKIVYESVRDTLDYRLAGPLNDANTYGQLMVILVPLALDRFWNERNHLLRLCAAWAFTVCALSVLFTFSRGAFLALLVALGFMVIRHPPRPLALLITMAVAIPLMQFVPANYVHRVSTVLNFLPGSDTDYRADESFKDRSSEMTVAWMLFAERPILGVGLSNYNSYYQQYSRLLGLDPRREDRSAHSLYLELAAEGGLLGLATFGAIMWMVIRGMREARQNLRRASLPDHASMVAAFSVGLAGYLTAAIFLHDAYSRFLWLLIGIALALRQVAQNELVAWREA